MNSLRLPALQIAINTLRLQKLAFIYSSLSLSLAHTCLFSRLGVILGSHHVLTTCSLLRLGIVLCVIQLMRQQPLLIKWA